MKKMLITAIIVLLIAGAKAQPGMPKQLTCTEEAFNFSFNLGSKWKIGAPKMGPAEFVNSEPDYVPALSFKIKDAQPDAYLPALFVLPFNAAVPGYAINQQNYAPLPPSFNIGPFNAKNSIYFELTQPLRTFLNQTTDGINH